MSKLFSLLVKAVFTQKMVKKLVGLLGDYLVKSSKNRLDNLLWTKVKRALDI